MIGSDVVMRDIKVGVVPLSVKPTIALTLERWFAAYTADSAIDSLVDENC